jgi:lysophospholipase L1-like esterase
MVSRRAKRWLRVTIGVVSVLVLLEASLRVWVHLAPIGRLFALYRADEVTGFSLRPNLHQSVAIGAHFTADTNSRGLRGAELRPKQPNERRILVLGDSFAYGFGVSSQETFAARLEEKLGVRVINAGVPGFGTAQELAFFERYADEIAPDVVVLQFFGNDYSDNLKHPVYLDGVLWTDPVLVFGHPSYLGSLVSRLLRGRGVIVGEDTNGRSIDHAPTAALLARLAADCDARKIPLRVFEVPNQDETAFGKRRIERVPRRLSLPTPPLLDFPAYVESTKTSPYLCDGHLNPAGHALVADMLAEELAPLLR